MKLRLLTGALHVAVLMSFLFVLPLPAAGSRDVRKFVLDSPDGRLKAEINVGDKVFWTVGYDGETILEDSYISMTLSDGTVYGEGPGFLKSVSGSEDSDIEALFYKKDIVSDRYNFLTLKFKGFDLMFRAYDDGVAYRFVSKSRKPFKVLSERAEFAFPDDWNAYIPYVRDFTDDFGSQFFNSFENTYAHTRLSGWDARRLAFLPIVIEAPEGKKICITESDLVDYPGMYLHNADGSSVLKGVFAGYPDEIVQGGQVGGGHLHILSIEGIVKIADQQNTVKLSDGSRLPSELNWYYKVYTIARSFVNTASNQWGSGHSRVTRSPVRGWMKDSRRAWRHWPASPGHRPGLFGAVHRVPQQGVTDVGHMHPDLVGAPGLQAALDVGVAPQVLQHRPVGHRPPALKLVHRHLFPVGGVAEDGGVHGARLLL